MELTVAGPALHILNAIFHHEDTKSTKEKTAFLYFFVFFVSSWSIKIGPDGCNGIYKTMY